MSDFEIERIEKTHILSVRDAVAELLAHNATLSESPRSVAFRYPDSPKQFAEGLQALSQLAVEVHMSFDKGRGIFVITTGSANSPVHPDLLSHSESMVPLAERHMNGMFLHNHPFVDGDVISLPSPGDWVGLAGLAKISGVRTSWIVSPQGITRFSLEKVPLGEISVSKMQASEQRFNDALWSRYGIIGRPEDSKQRSEAAELTKEYVDVVGGSAEVFPWNDQVGVFACVKELLALCK